MEQVNGEGWGSCAGTALGIIGLGAAAFATGPIGWAWAIGVAAGSGGTFLSGLDCVDYIVYR
jgi:hypothetical protein